MGEKYSNINELTAFGFLVNAVDGEGDENQSFPCSDAEDLSCGANFVPGKVTLARRRGEKVGFFHNCTPCCWYWQFRDGSRIYHFDGFTYDKIARENGKDVAKEKAGACPHCKNIHTNGGFYKKEEV